MTSSHKIDLYYFPPSPPCRTVQLVASVLGLELNLKVVNIVEGEHMDPSFLELNPQHTIPTIVDGDLVLWESRAIICYLVSMYAENDVLYSRDPKLRALIDQRLHFDLGTLYQRILTYFVPVLFAGAEPNEGSRSKVEEALQFLDKFLQNSNWVAGVNMTVADIAIVVSISTAEAIGFDISRYENIYAWFKRTKKALNKYGYEEIEQTAANTFGGMFRSKIR